MRDRGDVAAPDRAHDVVLELRALGKSWRRHSGHSTTLLHDAELTLARGDQVALLGPSGAGKSSLLHLCAGLDDSYTGELRLLGHTLRGMSPRARAALRRQHLGLASQAGGLVHTLSVLDNITLPQWLDGRPVDRARAEALMEQLDIAHLAQSAPQDLSGGEVARVALARALQHRPQLLLCDEPTHALDHARRQRVLDVLAAAAADGMTVLVATHDDSVAATLRRKITLHQGQLREG